MKKQLLVCFFKRVMMDEIPRRHSDIRVSVRLQKGVWAEEVDMDLVYK